MRTHHLAPPYTSGSLGTGAWAIHSRTPQFYSSAWTERRHRRESQRDKISTPQVHLTREMRPDPERVAQMTTQSDPPVELLCDGSPSLCAGGGGGVLVARTESKLAGAHKTHSKDPGAAGVGPPTNPAAKPRLNPSARSPLCSSSSSSCCSLPESSVLRPAYPARASKPDTCRLLLLCLPPPPSPNHATAPSGA